MQLNLKKTLITSDRWIMNAPLASHTHCYTCSSWMDDSDPWILPDAAIRLNASWI